MLKKYVVTLFLLLSFNMANGQMPNSVFNFLHDGCNSEQFLNFSIARINIYKLYYAEAVLLNLQGKRKWDFVREKINKEDDDLFKFRKDRDQTNPVTSKSEYMFRRKTDLLYDLMINSSLIVFSENIDPKNIVRINRRIVEECIKTLSKAKWD